ncbi:MAG: hypothetical protein OHK0039_15140 [Bacteroidia bacterium]
MDHHHIGDIVVTGVDLRKQLLERFETPSRGADTYNIKLMPKLRRRREQV